MIDQVLRMSRRSSLLFLLVSVLLAVGPAFGQFDTQPGANGVDAPPNPFAEFPKLKEVTVTVVPASTRVAQGGDLMVAVVFDFLKGYHSHPNTIIAPPGGEDIAKSFIPTQIIIPPQPASPLTAYPKLIQWPQTHEVTVSFFTGAPTPYGVYEGKAVAYLPVTVARDAAVGEATLTINTIVQACNDKVCLRPLEQTHTLKVTIMTPADLAAAGGTTDTGTRASDRALFEAFPGDVWQRIRQGDTGPDVVKFDLFGHSFEIDASRGSGLIMLLGVACVGGFLLNLTPCVLPVIPIKIMGLSQAAGNRARCLLLGFTMSIGVVAFWMALGATIAISAHFAAAAVARGESFTGISSTNQLFQYPAFTIGVGVVIAIMAVGMCGLFAVRLPQWVYRINPKHDSLAGSFGFGIMTAILSTPCTAPFMGAAAAWAAGQSWATTLATFGSIGTGMALPYLMLSAFPALVAKMPRTGPASELIKQVMGLLMLAAAAYFAGSGIVGILQDPPDPPSLMFWWVVMGFVMAAGAWLIYRTYRLTRSVTTRIIVTCIGLFLLVTGFSLGRSFTAPGPIAWTYYTPERLEKAVAEKKIVIMDFTAEWCANCKTLEHTVLYTDRIVALTKEPDIVPMKVDLTGNNTAGNAKLNELGRKTIPLLVVFRPDGSVQWKNDFYTVDNVVSAVEAARK